MIKYKEFRPTGFDVAGLGCEDQQEWLVAPVSINRDSGVHAKANWEACLKCFEEIAEKENKDESDYEVHRFGHWGSGWFELILIRPDTKMAEEAEAIEGALSDYPVLDDMLYSRMEMDEALETWQNCYTDKERLEYIRKHRSQFECHSFVELLQNVRGQDFCGYASELIEDSGY